MKIRYLFLLGVMVWLFGCTPVDSLNPLYTSDSETIYDDSLTGDWLPVDPEQNGGIAIVGLWEKGKDIGYVLTSLERENSGSSQLELEGRLVQLGGRRFLDVISKSWESRADSYSLQLKSTKSQTLVEPSVIRLAPASYLRFGAGDATGKLHADLIPAHWFMRITMKGTNLQLDWIDDEKFIKAIQQGKFHLGNTLFNENKDVVITAGTDELKKFIAEHADDDSLFTEHSDMLQRKATN
jgi:hypothetical protein